MSNDTSGSIVAEDIKTAINATRNRLHKDSLLDVLQQQSSFNQDTTLTKRCKYLLILGIAEQLIQQPDAKFKPK